MNNIKTLFLFVIFFLTLIACNQINNDRLFLGKAYAKKELSSALQDSSEHNVIDHKTVLIKDSLMAINIAESILFSMYGKENIIKQRPYETYYIDNYWIINGTLPKGHLGGTFQIIMDSRDLKIIKITHGK
jgi:hypothetical protein